jgi:hypothetical protein
LSHRSSIAVTAGHSPPFDHAFVATIVVGIAAKLTAPHDLPRSPPSYIAASRSSSDHACAIAPFQRCFTGRQHGLRIEVDWFDGPWVCHGLHPHLDSETVAARATYLNQI